MRRLQNVGIGASDPAKAAHIPDIDIQRPANPLQDVHPDGITLDEFLISGFTDPGKTNDVPLSVALSLQEPPQIRVTDHVSTSLLLSFPRIEGDFQYSTERALLG